MGTADIEASASSPTLGFTPAPLRRPAPPALRPRSVAIAEASGATSELPPVGVIAFNRMGYGPRPGDLERFASLGSDDVARLEAYIEEQLHPETLPDAEFEERLAAAGFNTLRKSFAELWTDHHTGPPGGPMPEQGRLFPYWETERFTFLRAIHSRHQLAAVLADFWHNHFNIFGADFWTAPLWVHYDRDIIRAHALGNFRALVEAVATSFPMMLYLDGYGNTVSGPNENFARELFELHTLGAENYFGVRRQDEVPVDADRRPMGYVDDDVYEATRALTGWGVDFTTGQFRYHPDRHDRFQKYILGKFLRSDQAAQKDGRDLFDLVAYHPGTARHVCRKLCRRLIADDPPQRVVEEAAAVFLAQREAPDQIRQVVRVILRSPEFRTTWGRKVKRPFEHIVSAFRATGATMSFALFHQPSDYFSSLFNQAGQPLFQWRTPDGYPDTADRWLGSNAMVGRWRVVNWLCDVKSWWDRGFVPFDPVAALPAGVRSPRQIADFYLQRLLGRPMADAGRREVIEFLARGRDPEVEWQGLDDPQFRERLWGMIALILASPDFLVR